MSLFKHEAKGYLRTRFYGIPLLLYVSKSEVWNGWDIEPYHNQTPNGAVYTLHITPFTGIGLIKPSFLRKKSVWDKK